MAKKISEAYAANPRNVWDGTEQIPINDGTASASAGLASTLKTYVSADSLPKAGGTLSGALNEAPAVTIASASTVNIGAAAANTINISGTTTITAFDSIAPGAKRLVVFGAALTLTHNGTSLILPTDASITTAAGDVAEMLSLGSGNWRCIRYVRKDGTALSGGGSGGDASTNTSSSVDSEISLFSGTGGKTLKRATGTGYAKVTSGVLSADSTATVRSDLQGDGLTSAQVGFRNIPQNSQSTAYTTVAADSGKHLLHPSADTTARTFTIDSNANVAYPVGTAITFINQDGAGVLTIAITSDTMRLAGAGTTGSRTLAANGVATAIKVTSTEWIISGTGLT